MKTKKISSCICLIVGVSLIIWLALVLALLVVWYPRELRRVSGPGEMVAVLKYGPSLDPLFLALLPICGTHNNCHVFVDVEKGRHRIARINVASGGDLPEDHDESEIRWQSRSLIVVDEHSGLTSTWDFERTASGDIGSRFAPEKQR